MQCSFSQKPEKILKNATDVKILQGTEYRDTEKF